MSRLSALLVVVAMIALSVANPSHAIANTGADIKGVGGGWVGFPDTSRHYGHFSFSAHTGPQGDFGQSQFSVSDEFGYPFSLSADIDCVNVFSTPGYHGAAWFSGIVTKVNDPTGTYFIVPGDRVYFSALDGGEPSVGSVDGYEAWYDLGVPCKLLGTADLLVEPPDVESGNIVINDPLSVP